MTSAVELGSYTNSTIAPGECAVHRAKYHPVMVIVPFVIGIPLVLAGMVGFVGAFTERNSPPGMAWFGLFLICLFGWLFYGWPLLRYRHDEIVITDRRVIVKMGIIARQARELYFNRLESVDLTQGVGGRILNFGTLVMRGGGGTALTCKFIREPLQFRAEIQQMQERSGLGYSNMHR